MTSNTINLDRPVNEVLADAWDHLHGLIDRLTPPGSFNDAMVDFDLVQGRVRFRWDNGESRIATAQLVALAQPEPGGPPQARFVKWAWDEPMVADPCRQPALKLLALGKDKGWEELTNPVVRAHIDRIWAFCGLAADLTGAAGAVMSRTQGREVYVTIGPLQHEE